MIKLTLSDGRIHYYTEGSKFDLYHGFKGQAMIFEWVEDFEEPTEPLTLFGQAGDII